MGWPPIDERDYYAEDRCATDSEAVAEYARNVGFENQGDAWILDPRDVWSRNPFYSGPPVPHPFDEDY